MDYQHPSTYEPNRVPRAQERISLIYYLRVFDRKNGDVLGFLVDITTKGIMVMRESPIVPKQSYSLRLRWRDAEARLHVVDFEGECRWCKQDMNPDLYVAGFSISAINSEDLDIINHLIEELGLPPGPRQKD